MAYKPNVYVLGAKPELRLETTGIDGTKITPTESRLSIKRPDGEIVTFSGGDLTAASGYQYLLYQPPTIGWYEYEGWVKDSTGREDASTKGFEVTDRVF
jgi:hypothetical protein